MIRLSRDDLIELQQGALRAAALDADAARLKAENAGYVRETRAHDLVDAHVAAAGLPLTDFDVAGLLADLPMSTAGALHEDAFLALLGQHILERRLGALIPTVGDDSQ